MIGTFVLLSLLISRSTKPTLFDLVLPTGLVVDDVVTVVESTTVKKQQGMTASEEAKSTMNELFTAAIATSLVLLAVFVPCFFLQELRALSTNNSQQRSYF